MIRLPGDPLLEARLTQAIEARLRARRQSCRDHSKLLEHALAGLSPLTRAERIQFLLLQRQFTGRWVPGFPSAVRTGRFLVRAWRRLRRDA
jgi:hypothetical protein